MLTYEELVRDPRAALEGLLRYLEADAGTVGAMLDAAAEEMPELAGHRTSSDIASSIGRWRTDLDQDVKQACEASFGRALEVFGYDG